MSPAGRVRLVLADFASCFALGALLEEAAQQTQRLGAATASAPVRCAHGSVLRYPRY
jgi:hypothetical protein